MTMQGFDRWQRRRLVTAALFVCLIVFLAVWAQHGIGPSDETRELRRLLARTTMVQVRGVNVVHAGPVTKLGERQEWVFVLDGAAARAFVQSILIQSRAKNIFRKTPQADMREMTRCEFYAGSERIDEILICNVGDDGFVIPPQSMVEGRHNLRRLYPYSYRHIAKLFREHPKRRGLSSG